MKIFIFLVFLLILIICQYQWYQLRKSLSKKHKELDIKLTSQQDLISLCILLCGYLGIYFYPFKISLYFYASIALVLGILLEISYWFKLKKFNFPKKFLPPSLLYATVMYFTTVSFGMLLLLPWK